MKSPSAIDLADRSDRPVSKSGMAMFVFKDELVSHGWNNHPAGWMLWDGDLGIPLHRIVCDDEGRCLEILAKQIRNLDEAERSGDLLKRPVLG